MKKKLAMILAAVVAMSTITGCGTSDTTTGVSDTQKTTAAEEGSTPAETEDAATTSVAEQTSTAATTTAATEDTATTSVVEQTSTAATTTAATTEPVVEERPEDIEAKKHIANMEKYDAIDNTFDMSYFYENPTEFFPEGDDQSYGIILNDIDTKTNSAQNQIQQAYINMANMSMNRDDDSQTIFIYFDRLHEDMDSVYLYNDFDSGFDFSDGKDITLGQVISYLPYYMKNHADSTDGSFSYEKLMEEMTSLSSTGEFFSNVTTYNPAELYDLVPYYYTLYTFGIHYSYSDFDNLEDLEADSSNFTKLGDVELKYSTPILLPQTDDYKWNFFTGDVQDVYVIPYKDVTNNIYGLASFDSNNNLINLFI